MTHEATPSAPTADPDTASTLPANAPPAAAEPWQVFMAQLLESIKDPPPALGWGKLELMGRHVVFGFLDEVEMAGAKFVRVVAPDESLQLVEVGRYGASAIYGFSPMPKAAALALVGWVQDRLWDLKRKRTAQPALSSGHREDSEDDDRNDDSDEDELGGGGIV